MTTHTDLSDPAPEPSPDHDVIVLRWAEIFLKGDNRPYFEQTLVDQLQRVLVGIPSAKIDRAHARILVDVARDELPAALKRIGYLFGVASYSPGRRVAGDLEAIAATAIEMARETLARCAAPASAPPPSFKVEVNRQNKGFPHRSLDIARHVGARVNAALGLPVDLTAPGLTIGVEIGHKGRHFVFTETIPGPGGLPVGSTGRVNLLISGGIDSPVAGWLAMKRGCRLMATYFHAFPFTGDATKDKVIELVRRLAAWHGPIVLFVVDFTEVQKQLRACEPAELAVVLYRRMMMRAAARLAALEGATALVTGENLAQVASQTLENLAAIEDAAPMPVLRPLLTYDKMETVALAKKIDTYDTSILPYDDCCSLFLPPRPATKARVKDARWAERELDVEALAASLASNAERIKVKP